MFRKLLLIITLATSISLGHAQKRGELDNLLDHYFKEYSTPHLQTKNLSRLVSVKIDTNNRAITIQANEFFGGQPFTPTLVESIYREIKNILPAKYRPYSVTILINGISIDQLIPNVIATHEDKKRHWGNIEHKGAVWVKNRSKRHEPTAGLQNRHLAIWASHGKFYKNAEMSWKWQRPQLFGTVEDLLTPTIVTPYLIPMLENAGAIVFSPRERDPQPYEAIVDNDTPQTGGIYGESDGRNRWITASTPGFAYLTTTLSDNENPFIKGTLRQAQTVNDERGSSYISWTPNIPSSGKYAVYVSYCTLNNSVSDADYTVYHKGQATKFNVNQRMGGGTWVYLGTFEFEQGEHPHNCVMLSNQSNENGVVTADAVRFGGGMGNIVRSGQESYGEVSGVSRYLEGARYSAQWAGMPYSVYSPKEGTNDYTDDINTRGLLTNYLCGGSVFMPHTAGLGVPIELAVALHSDAGAEANELIGTLGVYTTFTKSDGKLPNLGNGATRLTSRDLSDIILTTVTRDIKSTFGAWSRRYMYDRNYSESRVPEVPSTILEMFSHQNFEDMRHAHDPNFKFTMARAVYKSILQYISNQRGEQYVVQPLPIKNFAATLNRSQSKITLSWDDTHDPLEESAKAEGHIVYTRIGEGAFDHGTYVRKGSEFAIDITPNTLYSFQVTAVNKGGESFPSETLTAMSAGSNSPVVLIVNGFNRLSGPQVIKGEQYEGFDITSDAGVAYHSNLGFSGRQIDFDVTMRGGEGEGALGYSGNELEGVNIVGNTFNYPMIHGKAIMATKKHSFVSCNVSCVELDKVNLSDYHIVDLILGLEKEDNYSLKRYKTFSPTMQKKLLQYSEFGGSILVSGANIATDMINEAEQAFTAHLFKYQSAGFGVSPYAMGVYGMNTQFDFQRGFNGRSYAVQNPDALTPIAPAFATLLYKEDNTAAAVAHEGRKHRTIAMGFPFESITDEVARAQIMEGFLLFLGSR